jgi:peptidyl-prolyl cis-trans isomerase C
MRRTIVGVGVIGIAAVVVAAWWFRGVGTGQESALARVNGEPVSQEAFRAFLEHKRVDPGNDGRRQRMLDQYLERKMLADVIEDEGRLDMAKARAELAAFRREMLISRYFQEYLAEEVTEEKVRNYYTSHPDKYSHTKAKVAHILVRLGSDAPKSERQAKRTTIQSAYAVLESGRDFAKVAKKYSQDANSAGKGGVIGWIRKGDISQKFSDKAFGLESGSYSEPFRTDFGFHIVKVLKGPKTVKQPFEQVKGDIRYRLRNKVKKAELQRLREQGSVKRLATQ